MDMLEAITGELKPGAQADAWATQRDDGSWLWRFGLGEASVCRDTGAYAACILFVSRFVSPLPVGGRQR